MRARLHQFQCLIARQSGRLRLYLKRLDAVGWSVLQERTHEFDRLWRGLWPENFAPRVRLDLRELELRVVLIHALDLEIGISACRGELMSCSVKEGAAKSYLFLGRCAEDLDDLDELINAALTREKRSAQKQLCHHAAHRPNVYGNVSEMRHSKN